MCRLNRGGVLGPKGECEESTVHKLYSWEGRSAIYILIYLIMYEAVIS